MEHPDLRKALLPFLGPSEPEIGCEECFARIDEYVELELAGADPDAGVPGMRPHLVGCSACREEYESLRSLLRTDADA